MLINKEQSLFERYKLYVIAALVFFIIQTILIGYLIHINRMQKKTSSQLRDYEERYRELLRVDRSSRLGELTASLAHELNQPLTAILSTAQAGLRFLESGENDPVLYREILHFRPECLAESWADLLLPSGGSSSAVLPGWNGGEQSP